jgi:D-beta-D-heptose 7-phosphate kinase/D-beta-D-heptose 1-phosphate adenosyltransferase
VGPTPSLTVGLPTDPVAPCAWYNYRVSRSKIKSLEQLVGERRALGCDGKRVVFTNGCFDLLHPGHVRYLAEARSLGDALVVALNSDRAVRELKGPSRPILAEDERAEVMAALESVTFVTVFDDVSPLETIVAVAPDVLVKGGDWGLDAIIGREEVEAAGGRVLSLPFVDGCSTSDIIERIAERR